MAQQSLTRRDGFFIEDEKRKGKLGKIGEGVAKDMGLAFSSTGGGDVLEKGEGYLLANTKEQAEELREHTDKPVRVRQYRNNKGQFAESIDTAQEKIAQNIKNDENYLQKVSGLTDEEMEEIFASFNMSKKEFMVEMSFNLQVVKTKVDYSKLSDIIVKEKGMRKEIKKKEYKNDPKLNEKANAKLQEILNKNIDKANKRIRILNEKTKERNAQKREEAAAQALSSLSVSELISRQNTLNKGGDFRDSLKSKNIPLKKVDGPKVQEQQNKVQKDETPSVENKTNQYGHTDAEMSNAREVLLAQINNAGRLEKTNLLNKYGIKTNFDSDKQLTIDDIPESAIAKKASDIKKSDELSRKKKDDEAEQASKYLNVDVR